MNWEISLTRISVICITKNEEQNIEDCLRSVAWADEIVVVDSGSQDKTVELARKHTPKVFDRPWDGYGTAKNFALTQCTGEWIFWIDADERVTDELREEITSVANSGISEIDGYSVPRKAFFLQKWIKHCGWYPGRVTRLFRRSKGSFTENNVHEALMVDGRISALNSDLLHFTDPNLFHYFEKLNKYTTLAAKDLQIGGKKASIIQLILKPSWTFFRMYVIRRGFLDGLHGFVLCVLSACYVFTKYAKLWQVQRLGVPDKEIV